MYYESDNYLAHYGVKGQKWGVRRDEKKTLRKERKAYDKMRKDDYNKARKRAAKTLVEKGPVAAYKKTRTPSYIKDKRNDQLRRIERVTLTRRERDKLYRDLTNGKSYTSSYYKHYIASRVKRKTANKVASAVIKHGPTIAKATIAVGAAYVASKRAKSTMALPAHEILEATVHTIRNV